MNSKTKRAIQILENSDIEGNDYCCILDALETLGRYEDIEKDIIEYSADASKLNPNMTVYSIPNGILPFIKADKVEEFLKRDEEEILKRNLEREERLKNAIIF